MWSLGVSWAGVCCFLSQVCCLYSQVWFKVFPEPAYRVSWARYVAYIPRRDSRCFLSLRIVFPEPGMCTCFTNVCIFLTNSVLLCVVRLFRSPIFALFDKFGAELEINGAELTHLWGKLCFVETKPLFCTIGGWSGWTGWSGNDVVNCRSDPTCYTRRGPGWR